MEGKPTFRMVAKTLYGLEEILVEELKALGAEEIEPARRVVAYTGDQELLYRSNIYLRTALRVLKPIVTFEAKDADEVYQYLYDHVQWSDYLTSRTTFAFDTVVYSEAFTHSKFVAYRAKDAVSDFFTDREQRRPNVSVSDPDIRFHIHISHTTVSLSLDASGESLHKRGYRVGQNDAPLNEVLAAGMLLKAGWNGSCDFIDPMCGSGTLLTEAALIALGIPPGLFRDSYAFEKWPDFDPELLSEILDEWEQRPFEHQIIGSDISPKAIAISRANIAKAKLERYITLSIKSIEEYTEEDKPSDTGLLMTNPPYGERMKPLEIERIYGELGRKLKHLFSGYKAWVISSNLDCFNAIGLKHFVREKLYNGSIECELRGYELFEGKRNDYVREQVEKGEYRRHDNNKERPKRPFSPRRPKRDGRDREERHGYQQRERHDREGRPSSGTRSDRRGERPTKSYGRREREQEGDRPTYQGLTRRPEHKRPFERSRREAGDEAPRRRHPRPDFVPREKPQFTPRPRRMRDTEKSSNKES